MIYLTEGNIPLNAAYDDNIVQEANSTYQLTFKFPTNNILWQKLKEETFLIADDLHGEQDFVIFEVEKKHGYIQVYANQVMTLLNNYVVNPISLDRQTGSTALSQFAGSITRSNQFSFFSDIEDRHTFNIDSKNAMDAFAKDKHSIIGLWGGDLVRHGYQVRLLKNGGSENESLFMYQKNLSSYEHKTSTKSLRTRITFVTTIRGEGEKPVDKHYKVVVDSPLINKYSQIYEDVVEVNDQDVADEATLLKYGKQYFRTTLCDMLEDSIEIDVVGQSDVPVQMYDVVSVYHEQFDLDVRKKITKYNYSPMAKKLKSIGFGDFKSGLANAIGNAVSNAIKNETQHLQGQFATQLAKEIKNADLDFDRKKEELVNQFTDGLNAAKAKAEEVKKSLTETIDQRFRDFDSAGLREARQKADEALSKVGANTLLAQEAKEISEQVRQQLDNKVGLVDFQRVQETSKLYERIIGSSEGDIAEKVSRMAMTSQLFQVEVGKYANAGGPNMLRNSRADDGLKYWTEANGRLGFTSHSFYFNGQKRMFELRPGAVVKSPRFIVKRNADYIFNILAFDNNSKYFRVYFCKRKKGSSANFEQKQLVFDGQPRWVDGAVFDNGRTVKKSFKFNVGDYDDGYLQFEYDRNNPNKWGGLFMTELDFYEGDNDRKWQPAPEDATMETDKTLEATQTKLTLLQGSFAFQNLTSAGSIISQINAT
ncbi:phage tail spike protein, partial [Streptococcus oralis]|uniref:phage tail spike protein n=1 Tax=Streptococcus oralis TaxID=1303 RepID=UPI001F11C6D4